MATLARRRVSEMLSQSDDPNGRSTSLTPVQAGESAFVYLLPALAAGFPDGSVDGAPSGLDVAVARKEGKLFNATLTARRSIPSQGAVRRQGTGVTGQGGNEVRIWPGAIRQAG